MAAKPYLTFQSTSNFTLNVYDNTKHWNGTLYYSTDTTTWIEWDGTVITSSVDNKLYLRGTGNTRITYSSEHRWVLTGSNIECIGNIENLLDWETVALGNHPTMANYCFQSLFQDCTSLTTAPALPATTLVDSCYYGMFKGCSSLTTAPVLPATTLANWCYASMFQDCTSLTTPPALPATTLSDYCYNRMFDGCTAFKVSDTPTETYQYAWRIPTSGPGTAATNWNLYMLSGTGGTFTGNPTINTIYYVENPPVFGFSITFETNGGTAIPDIEEATELPDPLPTPTKSGYTFVAWYIDSALTTRAVAGETIEEDTTLYAKWHNLGSLFTEIADAIRSKDGTSGTIRDVDFGERVSALPSPKEEQTKTVSPTTSSQDVLPDANKVLSKVTVNAIPTETKSQQPNLSSGDQTINATSGKFMTSFTITKDTVNHIASNIRSGITLYGVTGSLQPAKEEETKTVTPNFSSGSEVVTPTTGKVLSQVTINKDSNLVASNIKKDVTVHGITGTSYIAIELTQAQYNALSTKDSNTYYLIVEVE